MRERFSAGETGPLPYGRGSEKGFLTRFKTTDEEPETEDYSRVGFRVAGRSFPAPLAKVGFRGLDQLRDDALYLVFL